MEKTRKELITAVLKRKDPGRFLYAPNYWQWFAHQKNHDLLPEEISSCNSQLDLIRHLGLDVFSRNIYSDQQAFWFGGLIHLEWNDIRVETDTQKDDHGATFFIHACGQQKDNLKLIAQLGVDGLEGVAFPSIGDVELDEAMALSGDSFIITGGISAMETQNLKTRGDIFNYVEDLFNRMRPYRNRFMLSASCNTPINTSWETIKYFRDAWLEYGC